MASKIDIKVTGVRGGSPNYQENKGQVVVFVDSSYASNQYISVDAFSGSGSDYVRRNDSKIEIKDEYGRVWEGTFNDLTQKLFS